MSVSVVASSDGNSAIIKVNGIERIRINADGSLVASGSPAAGARGNVLATMQAFASEFAGLIEGNGYTPLPNGLIFQWGEALTDSSGVAAFLLPTAFNSTNYRTIALHRGSAPLSLVELTSMKTKTSTAIAASSSLAGNPVQWWAVGK